ncbi:MAG TPA: hypothetical protein VFN71_09505 [Methylomirabilota bacterium]|nr:hypothetical protein [Methylomirabilota bacterium]
MARLLCIVSREQPLLYGYLTTALSEELGPEDKLELILDRRRERRRPGTRASREPQVDRRQNPTTDETIEFHGFAVVAPDAQRPRSVDPSALEQTIARLARAAQRRRRHRRARWSRASWILGAFALVILSLAGALAVADRSGRLSGMTANVETRAHAIFDKTAQALGVAPEPARPAESPTPAAPPPEEPDTLPPPRLPGLLEEATGAPAPAPLPPVQRPKVPARRAKPPSAPDVGGPNLTAFAGLPRIEVIGRSQTRERISYTLRLSDDAGKPLGGADVSIEGRTADGTAFRERLTPAGPPGTYRATLRAAGPSDFRVRVVLGDKRFEVPLAD